MVKRGMVYCMMAGWEGVWDCGVVVWWCVVDGCWYTYVGGLDCIDGNVIEVYAYVLAGSETHCGPLDYRNAMRTPFRHTGYTYFQVP